MNDEQKQNILHVRNGQKFINQTIHSNVVVYEGGEVSNCTICGYGYQLGGKFFGNTFMLSWWWTNKNPSKADLTEYNRRVSQELSELITEVNKTIKAENEKD